MPPKTDWRSTPLILCEGFRGRTPLIVGKNRTYRIVTQTSDNCNAFLIRKSYENLRGGRKIQNSDISNLFLRFIPDKY